MALTDYDQSRIKEYLLGKLNENEQQAIEERLMLEDDLFEELEISKGELIEEFHAGELNREERKWFQENYLSSNDGRERYALVLAIDRLALPNSSPQPQSLFERLGSMFKAQPWMTATAFAATAVIVAGALLLFRPQQQNSHSVVLTHTLPTRSEAFTNPLPASIALPPNTDELRATLEFPKRFPQGTHFEVQLDKRTDPKKPVKVLAQDERGVTVAIPVSDIPRGEYALKITAVMSDGTRDEIPGGYRFDIK